MSPDGKYSVLYCIALSVFPIDGSRGALCPPLITAGGVATCKHVVEKMASKKITCFFAAAEPAKRARVSDD